MGAYAREQDCAIAIARTICEIEMSQFGILRFPLQTAGSLDASLNQEKLRAIARVETAAQDAALDVLKQHFPKDYVCANKESPALGIFAKNQRHRTWTLDTLDGGHNYIAGDEHFGATLACRIDDEFVLSVLALPKTETIYVATTAGIAKHSPQAPDGTLVTLVDGQPRPDDLVYLGGKVPGGVILALGILGNDIGFKQSSLPTVCRAINVLEGKARAYVTFHSDIYDMGPVSFAIQAARGVFLNRQGEAPRWQTVAKEGKERIILEDYALLGPKHYCATLLPLVNDIIGVADKE